MHAPLLLQAALGGNLFPQHAHQLLLQLGHEELAFGLHAILNLGLFPVGLRQAAAERVCQALLLPVDLQGQLILGRRSCLQPARELICEGLLLHLKTGHDRHKLMSEGGELLGQASDALPFEVQKFSRSCLGSCGGGRSCCRRKGCTRRIRCSAGVCHLVHVCWVFGRVPSSERAVSSLSR